MARSLLRMAFTPLATIFSASISSPESVSSSTARRGSSTAICTISLRFFSPPEKPSFTGRFRKRSSISSMRIFFPQQREKIHRVHLVLSAIFADGVQRGAQKIRVADAGNLHRILERHEQPLAGGLFWLHRQQVFTVIRDGTGSNLVALAPRQHLGQRAFARAIRPHDGMHLSRI